MMKGSLALAVLAMSVASHATMFVDQPPANGGGLMRWSKLWVDPLGQNDLDGDAICYADFTLAQDSTIEHLEWWGDHNPNHGFQIEVWKQDPGTIAYQPYAVFRGIGAQPEAAFTTTSYSASSDPTGTVHFGLDLDTPISLAANNAANPRWFLAVIGLTDVPYLEWNWAQGVGGSNRTFQWIRGGNEGGGDVYRSLGDGRALVMSGTAVPEPASILALGIAVTVAARRRRR